METPLVVLKNDKQWTRNSSQTQQSLVRLTTYILYTAGQLIILQQ